jgi:hypothetical protein
MTVKPTSLFVFLLSLAGQFCKAQELSEINVRIKKEAFTIHSIVFTLNGLDLFISSTGNIFPVNTHGIRKNGWKSYACDSSEYEYYDGFDSDDKTGKIKSINGITIDYYDKFSNKTKIGKIKSIGNTNIDYYDNFDNDQKKGKIKSIGKISIDYYDSFDRDEKKGKIKSFGNYNINYYDSFDGDEKMGKLSKIGPVKIDYYDRFSIYNKVGTIKSISGNSQDLYVTVVRKAESRGLNKIP